MLAQKLGHAVKIDDVILEELRRGGGTAKDIGERLAAGVQRALDRLVKADKVRKAGFPGKGNLKTYSLPPIRPRKIAPD